MKNKKISNELRELMEEKNAWCVSVVLPLQPIPSDNKLNTIAINKTLDKVSGLIAAKYPENGVAADWLKDVLQLQSQIDLRKGLGGVGLYVSANKAKLVEFPFPVKERVNVGESFEVREVVYKEHYLKDYFVLTLNKSTVHLKRGNGPALTEIKDENFPVTYVDDYEYNSPAPIGAGTTSMRSVEKDKSVMMELRTQAFFHTIDEKLTHYLHNNHIPMVVTGVKKDLGYFEKLSKHTEHIVGYVQGSYDTDNGHQLPQKVWEVMEEYRDREEDRMVSYIREQDPGMVSIGTDSVWRDANLGKGHKLVVEKDFVQRGFVGQDELKLLSIPPNSERYTVLHDAVDQIIETVMEKDGEVIFVENGKLEEFGHIAMSNRF